MADAFTPRFVDLVRNITTTSGTGNFALGSPVSGFSSFAEAIKSGETFYYSVIGVDRPTEREVGRGTMMPSGTIKREPLAGQTLTDFTEGTKTIALVAAAEWYEKVQAGGANGSGAGTAATRADLSATPTALGAVVLSERGREGLFLFDGANLSARVTADTKQGLYVAPKSDTSGASGAWVRVSHGDIDPRWFGIVADDPAAAAANSAALDALLSYLRATGNAGGHPNYRGTRKVRFGQGDYHFATACSIKSAAWIEGQSQASVEGPSTRLIFATGGIIIERYNTLAGASDTVLNTGGDGSILRNLHFKSLQARPSAGTYAAQARDGVLVLGRCQIEDCYIEGFTRDGVHIESGALAGASNVNNNNTIVRNCSIQWNGRHGLYIDGVDSNACVFENIKADFNNNWGIYDSGFLNNHHSGHHAAANGQKLSSLAQSKGDGLSSVCVYPATSGTIYCVSPGQAAAASTTQPGTNGAVWVPLRESAGTVSSDTYMPAWVSGMTWKEGGSYFNDGINTTVWVNCYTETGQGQPFMGNRNMCLGGTWEQNPNAPGGYVDNDESGKLRSARGFTSGSAVLIAPQADQPELHLVGAPGYFFPAVKFRPNGNGPGPMLLGHPDVLMGYSTEFRFRDQSDSETYADLTTGGLNLGPGKDLKFNGTAVPLRNAGASKLIGRGSGGAGVVQEITLGSGLTMSGSTLSATGGGWSEITLNADSVAGNSLAFGDISDGTNAFVYTPPPNSNFEIEAALLIETATSTNLPRVGVRVDAQGTGAYGAVQIDQTAATPGARVTADGTFTAAAIDVQMAAGGLGAANTPYLSYVTIRGRSGAAPAAIRVQLACETAAANTCRVRQGSQMRVKAS